MKNKWYILTGAPSSGKTSIIRYLEKIGYFVIHEAARIYIDSELSKGKTLEEIRKDEQDFQNKVLDMKLEIEKNINGKNPNEIAFFDRGIPDSESYMQLHNFEINERLKIACEQCKYNKIFLLDMLPYENDYARNETDENRMELQNLLEFSYKKLGFEVIKVPILHLEARVKFILNNL